MALLPQSEGGWRGLLFALTGVTLLVFLWQAWGAADTIQDDARQFLLWMPRLSDPGALPGDLLADYWQSVTPPTIQWLYGAAAAVGLSPVAFSKLLPIVLLLACAWGAWQVAMQMTGGRPAAAFVAAAFVMAIVVHDDSVFSATPRAFSPPLLLFLFDALLRRASVQAVVCLALLGATYPASAIVGLTMLGLSYLRVRPRPGIELNLRSVLTVGAATLAVAVPVLAFSGATDRWEPLLTLEQAQTMPNLASPDGRSDLWGAGGPAVGWLCSGRMGLLPQVAPCDWSGWAAPVNVALFVPLLLLAWRGARGEGAHNRIYLWALIACTLWWVVAYAVAFQLHLPSRYTQRVLALLQWLAIGQMLGVWLTARWGGGRTKAAAIATGSFLLVSSMTPIIAMTGQRDPGFLPAVRALPAGARLAGIGPGLDAVPALTGVPVLVTAEHAIPYHWGYFGQVTERMRATLQALSTDDPAVLRAFARTYGVTHLAADRSVVAGQTTGRGYRAVMPAEAAAAEALMRQRPSLLSRSGARCLPYQGPEMLLYNLACLAT